LYIKFKVKFPARLKKQQTDTLRTCLPDLVPSPTETDIETTTMMDVDENNLKQDRYKGHPGGNAYDESDEEEGRGGGGVQCAQQ